MENAYKSPYKSPYKMEVLFVGKVPDSAWHSVGTLGRTWLDMGNIGRVVESTIDDASIVCTAQS